MAGAVRFDDQAMFHPREYCLALAAAISGDGSFVFESTRVVDVDSGAPCTVRTDRGDLRAAHVVLATLLPFLDRGGFFAIQHRREILGLPLPRLASTTGGGSFPGHQ